MLRAPLINAALTGMKQNVADAAGAQETGDVKVPEAVSGNKFFQNVVNKNKNKMEITDFHLFIF